MSETVGVAMSAVLSSQHLGRLPPSYLTSDVGERGLAERKFFSASELQIRIVDYKFPHIGWELRSSWPGVRRPQDNELRFRASPNLRCQKTVNCYPCHSYSTL